VDYEGLLLMAVSC